MYGIFTYMFRNFSGIHVGKYTRRLLRLPKVPQFRDWLFIYFSDTVCLFRSRGKRRSLAVNILSEWWFQILRVTAPTRCDRHERWFQIFFMFIPIWGRFPFCLIFFRWIETTNQIEWTWDRKFQYLPSMVEWH